MYVFNEENVMSIFGFSPIAYTSEGNSLRRPVQGPGQTTQSATHDAASPFASVLATQKTTTEAAYTAVKSGTSSEQALKEKVAHANVVAQVQMDKTRMQALEQMGQNMSNGEHGLLDIARNDVTMRNLRSAIGSFNLRAPVTPMADSIKAGALAARHGMGGGNASIKLDSQKETNTALDFDKKFQMPEIGKLSAQFESGSKGISAIGYDRTGGTSYGKYQIASRVGSMDRFLTFLDTAAPDIAQTLRDAGPANTGGRKGSMPNAWKNIAEEQPERFEALQDKFIYDSHYVPALSAISESSPLGGEQISSVMREVLWSTAVQHGPAGAARIFARAYNAVGDSAKSNSTDVDEKVIHSVYAQRAEQFGSSTKAVQEAVRNRMHQEKNLALAMLENSTTQKA